MPSIGFPYKRDNGPDTADAIVIGSGIGGLATAVLLGQKLGKRVLVLERHYTAGGFTHSFHRPGYEWDVGVHYVGQVGSSSGGMGAMFQEIAGDGLRWASMGDVYDTVVLGDRRYEYVAGLDRWRERMKHYFPADAAAIDGYLETVRATTRASMGYWAEKAVPGLVSGVAGWAMRRPFLRYARRATRAVLEDLTGNQELIAVLTAQWGDYGLPPAESSFGIHAIVTRHYFEGGYYPVGGASRIAAAIVPRIEASGGRVLVGAEVTGILYEDGRVVGVRMADGREFRAPMVISDAGLPNTLRLLPPGARGRAALDAVLERVKPSAAHLSLYVGLERTAGELGLPKTNYWVYQHADFEGALARFARDPDAPLPLAYISFPSAKDPTFTDRYPGHATIEVVTMAPYDWFKRWEGERWRRRGEDYEALKARLSAKLLDALYAQVPQARGHIAVAELSTPLSTRHFANYARGEIYGLAHDPERFEARALRPRTPVPGLWLTGQDICSCGVGGALAGGYLTASAVAGRSLMPRP